MKRILYALVICPTLLVAQVKVSHEAGDWGESAQSIATFTAKEASCAVQIGPQTLSYIVSENGMIGLSLNGSCAFHDKTDVVMNFDWKGQFISFPVKFIPSSNSSKGVWTILDDESAITKYLMESARVRVQATPENDLASTWTAVFGLSGSTKAINEVLNKHGVTVNFDNVRKGLTKGMYD